MNPRSSTLEWQKILPIPALALLVVFFEQSSGLRVNAQEGQNAPQYPAAPSQETKPGQGLNSSNPAAQGPAQAFELSVTQSSTLPAQAPAFTPQQIANPYYPPQTQFPAPAQRQFTNPGQAQFGYPNRPQFRNPTPPPPTRIFSAAAVSHSGPGLLSDPSPLAYDLTICQDDANFHPPYLVPQPEILNPGSAFGESPHNVRLWQAWADRVAMDAWMAWRQSALPVFGCAEIDIKLNRDGSFQAKRGNYRHHLPNAEMPEEQSAFLMQLDPFLKHLQNTRVFRIPDNIVMRDSPTLEFQIQVGVRQKDRANPYSWCGFMNDWKWWTGSGLQVYHRIECDLRGLGKH